ncbi:hypothetical protein ACJ73_00300 [Blastomyces percursus]|uniref:Uncharacterized protein n=1 Tax=Blastomyces percursus TaxID=1658174 RepID=A0A1J9QIK3_9EURO|nr:hypothetical protein ACJ73_00300 [Blastomyces percursus]
MAAFYDQQSLTRHMNRRYDDPTLELDCGSIHGCDLVFTSIRELKNHYDDLHSIPAPRRRRGCEPALKSDMPCTPQVAAEDGMELEVTTPESFKRKGMDTDDEGAGKRPRKQRKCQLASKETGTAEPRIVGSGPAPEGSSSVTDSAYSSCARSPDRHSDERCDISENIDPRLFFCKERR